VPFIAPKTAAFKQFVILDAEGVVAALSAIDGGQVDEILTRSATEGGSSLGGELDAKVAKGRAKRAKTRKVEEEMRLARTRHSAAAKLIEALEAQEAIGIVEGPFDKEIFAQVESGMVLLFKAELHLHPLPKAYEMLRSFIDVAPKLDTSGASSDVMKLKSMLGIFGVLAGVSDKDARLLIEPTTFEPQCPRLLLPVPEASLEVPLDDVLGEVNVFAQVERVIRSGTSHQVVRMLQGGPASSLERDTIAENLPKLLDGLQSMGIEVSMDDVFVKGPAVLLRPICAYR
jgi:hypothetical protein